MLLFLVLYPSRVAAGEGWLSTRGPLRGHRVRTDHLVSVRCLDGVGQRLVLRDAFGARVEIDPRVLVANPPLWHRLDEDARRSARRGSLTCGETALRRVSERIDRETAQTVFRMSGPGVGPTPPECAVTIDPRVEPPSFRIAACSKAHR